MNLFKKIIQQINLNLKGAFHSKISQQNKKAKIKKNLFRSEIMTAVAVRKDESLQEDNSTDKSKPKRSVSFKNQPAKQKGKNKKRLVQIGNYDGCCCS